MKNILKFLGVIISFFIILSCEDKPTPPVVTTMVVSEITAESAKSGGTISDDGGASITSCGVCWGTGVEPTTADKKTTDAILAGSFSSNITNLEGGTVYYVRAYATNSAGTAYGTAMSFTTLGQAPTASNTAATNVTTTSATLNGSANANYLSTVVSFEYGTTTSYGNTKDAKQSPITGNTNSEVNVDLTGLNPGTTYHFRLKAVNSLGITYSSDATFVTLGQIPIAVTQSASNITANSVTFNGTVNANYLSTIVTFEYGNTTSYGSTITAIQSPVTGKTETNVSANITGLTEGTTYHFRVKAENSLGIAYGNSQVFTTITPIQFNQNITYGNLTDIDGNVYKTVIIGTQTWMAENLKTTKYKDGVPIPLVTDKTEWSNLTTPGYCFYNNDPGTNMNIYGAIYNYFAVQTNKVCPLGWHVSSENDWATLSNYLGGETIAGGKLKEAGTYHFTDPNFGSTNETGFTGLPGGIRDGYGLYSATGTSGFWWVTNNISINGSIRSLHYSTKSVVWNSAPNNTGLSVRCIKD